MWASLLGVSAELDALLRAVGLEPARPDPVRTFSAGMRRRTALARLHLKRPTLPLLGEPFSAFREDAAQGADPDEPVIATVIHNHVARWPATAE